MDRGFGVLRFDFSGLGQSAGDFAETTFGSNLEDLRSAAAWLESEHASPRLLVGHSLGGAAVLAVAGELPSVEGVATIGAPAETDHLRTTLLRSAPELEHEDVVEVDLAGRTIRVGRDLIEDLRARSVLDRVKELRRPLLFLHSPVDEVVGIEHARRLYEAARHPKSFVSLDDADHLLLRESADARYAAEVIAAWAGRYVGTDTDEQGDAAVPITAPSERGVVVAHGGSAKYRVDLRAGDHALVADEPGDVGGADEGPTPYELLLGALGSCTVMTLKMVADREGIPLESVTVELQHRRIHAKDCEDCETEGGKIDEIERAITIAGDLEPEARKRLHQVADRCPVHRSLTSETKIRSREV